MHLRTYLATTRRILTQLPASSGSSMTQPQPSRALLPALEAASTVAKELSDEYISTEHLLIGLAKGDTSGSAPTVARILADAGATPQALIEALPQVRGSSRVTSANPEGTYKTLEKYGTDLTEAARSAGALGAKLTGGGLGGCVIALATGESATRRVRAALEQAGAPETWSYRMRISEVDE